MRGKIEKIDAANGIILISGENRTYCISLPEEGDKVEFTPGEGVVHLGSHVPSGTIRAFSVTILDTDTVPGYESPASDEVSENDVSDHSNKEIPSADEITRKAMKKAINISTKMPEKNAYGISNEAVQSIKQNISSFDLRPQTEKDVIDSTSDISGEYAEKKETDSVLSKTDLNENSQYLSSSDAAKEDEVMPENSEQAAFGSAIKAESQELKAPEENNEPKPESDSYNIENKEESSNSSEKNGLTESSSSHDGVVSISPSDSDTKSKFPPISKDTRSSFEQLNRETSVQKKLRLKPAVDEEELEQDRKKYVKQLEEEKAQAMREAEIIAEKAARMAAKSKATSYDNFASENIITEKNNVFDKSLGTDAKDPLMQQETSEKQQEGNGSLKILRHVSEGFSLNYQQEEELKRKHMGILSAADVDKTASPYKPVLKEGAHAYTLKNVSTGFNLNKEQLKEIKEEHIKKELVEEVAQEKPVIIDTPAPKPFVEGPHAFTLKTPNVGFSLNKEQTDLYEKKHLKVESKPKETQNNSIHMSYGKSSLSDSQYSKELSGKVKKEKEPETGKLLPNGHHAYTLRSAGSSFRLNKEQVEKLKKEHESE